jgi:hypothetical protein
MASVFEFQVNELLGSVGKKVFLEDFRDHWLSKI